MLTISQQFQKRALPLTNNHALASNNVFGDLLSLKDRTYLVEHSSVRRVPTGETLCEQNKIEQVLYIILTGEVEIYEIIDNENITLGVLQSGNLVGEIGALFSIPRIATVTATKTAVVLEITSNNFLNLINKTPRLYSAVYQRVYQRSLEAALNSSPPFEPQYRQIQPELSRLLQHWNTH